MEVCPQFNEDTGFVGAATIAQVKLFNNHPTGKVFKEERLRALAGDGGIQECGFAQNCVEVLPQADSAHQRHLRREPRRADPEGLVCGFKICCTWNLNVPTPRVTFSPCSPILQPK
jgi:hypothetical protein